jgi:hypothetical protein
MTDNSAEQRERVAHDLQVVRDPSAPLEARIAAGARLWSLIDEAERSLAPLKETLRAEGRARLGNSPGSEVIEGEGMTRALVTVPKTAYQVAKGTDMSAVRAELGEQAFALLFEEIVTYKVRASNLMKVASLHPTQTQTALSVIAQVEPTPRVAFRSAGEGVDEIG